MNKRACSYWSVVLLLLAVFIMMCHGSHYIGHQVVQVSARSKNSIVRDIILHRFYRSGCTAQICWIAQQGEVDRVLDCDELHDVKRLGVVVSGQPPLQHLDDRILEEHDSERLVHQTVGGHVVTVRYTNSPLLTLSSRKHCHNLKIVIINSGPIQDSLLN